MSKTLTFRDYIVLYLHHECNMSCPSEEDVDAQIKLGLDFYDSEEEFKDSIYMYFNVGPVN